MTRLRIGLACFWAGVVTAVSVPTMGAITAQKVADLPGGDFSTQMYTSIQRAPGRPNDLFVSRADGKIYRVDLTTNTQSLFMQLPTADYAVGGGYWGLLGFTFAPDFGTSGNVYVHVADDRTANPAAPPPSIHHSIYIRRYTLADPLSAAPVLGAAANILKWDQHGADHSGGWIGFQPGDANTLWISSGDGGNFEGAQRDAKRTGQDPTDFLSSILRVNVSGSGAGAFGNYSIPANNPYKDGVGGAPEVWSIGLRSPWGGSFDRQTGDFIIGDVGSSLIGGNPGRQEIDFERADSLGGRNYGWRVMEGTGRPVTQDTGAPASDDPRFTPPVYDYPYGGAYSGGGAETFAGRSVTGGFVYRGPLTELQGMYIFGDWSSRQIWGMEIDRDANGGLGAVVPGSLVDLSAMLSRQLSGGGPGLGVTSFGEDEIGNLYYVQLDGNLFKIAAVPEPATISLFALGVALLAVRRRTVRPEY